MRTFIGLCVFAVSPTIAAQEVVGSTMTDSVFLGRVVAPEGAPVAGATARFRSMTDSIASDSAGRFALPAAAAGPHTLLIRKLGFVPESVTVVLPSATEITIRLRRIPRTLETVAVTAGTYRAGYDRQATLTPIQVVNVPGAGGDLGRAIQSLPGVQAADEGNGVYVRGGEAGETRVVLNDAVMLITPRLESPSGTAAPTVNPFLLDGISFSAGSFSVRRGNALSGIVDLRTQGRPTALQASTNVALNVVSVTIAAPLGASVGARFNAGQSDATLLLKTNSSTRRYTRAPHGQDLAGTIIWAPRKSGELKLFAIQQRSAFGVEAGDPAIVSSAAGDYDSNQRNRFVSLSWRDVFGRISTSSSVAVSRFRRGETMGIYHSNAIFDGSSAFAEIAAGVSRDFTLRVGGDLESADAGLDEHTARWLPNGGTAGPVDTRERTASTHRNGLFIEGQWRIAAPLRVTAGLRSDEGADGARTYDPRIDLAARLAPGVSATAAWGVYHQRVAAPVALRLVPGEDLQPARARQHSLGLQLEKGRQLIRAEIYEKFYSHLTGLDQQWRAIGGGSGRSRGVDFFARTQPARALSARAVYSFVDSRRTDPGTRVMTRGPADISHSLLLVTETAWSANRWRAAAAYRAATGRPFTPIVGGVVDADGTVDPRYGFAMSDRLPGFARVDLSLSTVRPLTPAIQLVAYSSISNLLDRKNIFMYRYSEDFEQRIPIRSAFKRAVYVGASISYTKRN